jgi:hypothetical protein
MVWKTGSALLVIAMCLAGCSQAPDGGGSQGGSAETREAASEDAAQAPAGVGVTAALGVAFNYRYAFSLPAAQIAGAQETHAAACEQLGIAKCRITGMRYQLLGENRVEAMLAFKLDPAIARAFGKQGIAAIQKAEGTLTDAEITGTDAGAEIQRLAAERARVQEELARIDRELARTNLPASERTELQRQRADLTTQVQTSQAGAAQQRESLANTPMVFDYRAGRGVRGFDAGAPFASALDLLSSSAQGTLAFVLGALALLAPPGLILLIGVLVWRRLRRRILPAAAAPAAAASD